MPMNKDLEGGAANFVANKRVVRVQPTTPHRAASPQLATEKRTRSHLAVSNDIDRPSSVPPKAVGGTMEENRRRFAESLKLPINDSLSRSALSREVSREPAAQRQAPSSTNAPVRSQHKTIQPTKQPPTSTFDDTTSLGNIDFDASDLNDDNQTRIFSPQPERRTNRPPALRQQVPARPVAFDQGRFEESDDQNSEPEAVEEDEEINVTERFGSQVRAEIDQERAVHGLELSYNQMTSTNDKRYLDVNRDVRIQNRDFEDAEEDEEDDVEDRDFEHDVSYAQETPSRILAPASRPIANLPKQRIQKTVAFENSPQFNSAEFARDSSPELPDPEDVARGFSRQETPPPGPTVVTGNKNVQQQSTTALTSSSAPRFHRLTNHKERGLPVQSKASSRAPEEDPSSEGGEKEVGKPAREAKSAVVVAPTAPVPAPASTTSTTRQHESSNLAQKAHKRNHNDMNDPESTNLNSHADHNDDDDSNENEIEHDEELDYDVTTLRDKAFSSLCDEVFTHDPRTPAPEPAVDSNGNPMSLAQRLSNLNKMKVDDQHSFFKSQTDDEWMETGTWFIEKFRDDLQKLMTTRLERRQVSMKYEDQIRRRQVEVENVQDQVKRELEELGSGGRGLLKDRKAPVATTRTG